MRVIETEKLKKEDEKLKKVIIDLRNVS